MGDSKFLLYDRAIGMKGGWGNPRAEGFLTFEADGFKVDHLTVKYNEITCIEKATNDDARILFIRILRADNLVWSLIGNSHWIPSSNKAIDTLFPELLARFSAGQRRARAATAAEEQERITRLKEIVKVSKRLEVTRMASVLEIDEGVLWKRIFKWAAEFGFVIDKDVVEFGAGQVDAFIASLDEEFKGWNDPSKEL